MRRVSTGVVGVLAAVSALVAGLLVAAPAQAADLGEGLYQSAHSDTITAVEAGSGGLVHRELGYEEWREAGSPAPRPSPTEYVKYPWSPTLYAVTYWPDGLQWERLTFPQWQRAGFPAARDAGWVEGSRISRFDSSPELIVRTEDDAAHVLTDAEWRAMDRRPPTGGRGAGYYKRSWDPTIAGCTDQPEGVPFCERLNPAEWVLSGRPTPLTGPTIPGDRFYRSAGSPDVVLYGAGFDGVRLTPEQWRAAGSPVPEVV